MSGVPFYVHLLRYRLVQCLAIALLLIGLPAQAADNRTLDTVPPSGYREFWGQPFFLLSDASFGSDQIAQVRLEAPGRGYKSALQRYGGADMLVYRVADPLTFLKTQRNLHRIDIKANHRGEGLANTLSYLWDRWNKEARRSWQRVLSFTTRQEAVTATPRFSMGNQISVRTHFENNPQYEPLKGYELVARFRYPIWDAKGIEPPKTVKLEGSSSEFLSPVAGNVMVPLGRLKPGLYIVEGIIGGYRAHTLLFVSDTVAVTKNTSGGMLVWTADRNTGKPVTGARLAWTDGVGVLQSATTGPDGVAELAHDSPEKSYLLGVDQNGGSFISENFYYDSEIYNTKLYAFTDRPLYRPGDEVRVKFIGRSFRNATDSTPVAGGPLRLNVLDPSGGPVLKRTTTLTPDSGADIRFTLPANAMAGGYTLRFDYGDDSYGGAFRVAEYIKPHFDISLALDKTGYATDEAVTGKIQLRYPDGKPVKDAHVSISLRAQRVSMVEGELQYAGLFPIKLEQQELRTDGKGDAALLLPAAAEPSRYVVTAFASDGAAYRVKATRELLIARGATPYKMTAPAHFTNPGQSVDFTLQTLDDGLAVQKQKPSRWELLRLESRTRTEGALSPADGDADRLRVLPITFNQPGSYVLSVRDDAGALLAATNHWVAGDGLQTIPGNIEIVFDHDHYRTGDTAQALITFPEPVDDALLTLERDKVEQHGLLSTGGAWLSLEKVAATQWRARIKVGDDFSPNMTFSVLYVKNGDWVFQNAGVTVRQPTLDLTVKSNKAVFAPGETVTLDLDSAFDGKPMPASLTVSVVDEMVYVLQPEIAPSIVDFFYHPRRNNVRTTSSLSFIGYDLATSAQAGGEGAARGRYNERGVKMLERPRRDDKDTAAWEATLRTDANGHARMTFTMPESLTRWRVTVRAIAENGPGGGPGNGPGNGMVGQRTASIRSDKSLYLKWAGPQRYRAEDQPRIDMIAFNQSDKEITADLVVKGAGFEVKQSVTLKQGANHLRLPMQRLQSGEISAELKRQGKSIDRLQTTLSVAPAGWLSPHELSMAISGAALPLPLPEDAQDIRLRFVDNVAAQFARVAGDLIDYPYGCAEQTASRLIPLALARRGLASRDRDGALDTLLRAQRQRLALLAGVNGRFGWWGGDQGSGALLTAYAYYADWLASRVIGLTLPPEHWRRTLDAYKESSKEPVLHRALALWFINEMGLPVATPLSGVAAELSGVATEPWASSKVKTGASDAPPSITTQSLVFSAPDSPQGRRVATVLAAQLYRQTGQPLPKELDSAANAARQALSTDSSVLARSLLLMADQGSSSEAQALLAQTSAAMPTIDRALALVWLDKSLGGSLNKGTKQSTATPQGDWKPVRNPLGLSEWRWTGQRPPQKMAVASPDAISNAVFSYHSRAQETADLPITIERRLYRLSPMVEPRKDADAEDITDPAKITFSAKPLTTGQTLDSNTLYVDEIVLSPRQGAYRYGLVEAPLPPGGEVESTTWGLRIEGLPDTKATGPQPFQRPVISEMGALAYHQPIAALERPMVLRQLVRFSLPGRFTLPPVRYFQMYQPESKAFQGDGKTAAFPLTVE